MSGKAAAKKDKSQGHDWLLYIGGSVAVYDAGGIVSGPVSLETLANAFDYQLGLHHESNSGNFALRVAKRASY